MEEKEFEGIEIPEKITDPEERELFALLRKAQNIAIKKDIAFLVHTISLSAHTAISLAAGCPHCISIILNKALENDPKLSGILMDALRRNQRNECNSLEQLINHAKKNPSAGN